MKEIEKNKLPQHIAIIMDGNGRWAKKRLLPRNEGHRKGVMTLSKIANYCNEIGIKNKFLDINEVRYEENRGPIEALNDTIVLGLNDVLYNTKKGSVYTPNTNKTTNLNDDSTLKGGEEDENRN